MRIHHLLNVTILTLTTFWIGSAPVVAAPLLLQKQLASFLQNQPTASLDLVIAGEDPAQADRELLTLYTTNSLQPLWFQNTQLGNQAISLIETLQNATAEGLNPDDYKLAEILTLRSQDNPDSLVKLDVLLTLALARYVADMQEGSADPCLLDPKLFSAARDKEVSILQVVQKAMTAKDLKLHLHNQAPTHDAYRGLKKALAKYRDIAGEGEWNTIPDGPLIKLGMQDTRIPIIAERLARTEASSKKPENDLTYDQSLQNAVKTFQRHFLLEDDGIIGPKTLAALNIPASSLIDQIILNMERWRWLPHSFPGKHIFVNIAGFELFATREDQVEISMPVIVGKVYHKTPVFSGTIRYMEINPYWNIPNSIARKEMVPKMQKDPTYLKNNNIHIFSGWQDKAREIEPTEINWQTIGKGIQSYRLRQDPGPENALGRIKFIFPNTHNVYLHDTPTRHLFTKITRSFSHGCIRVSQPLELGSYLLQDNKKPLQAHQLKELIDTNNRKIILLDNPIPVHILYRTARASTHDDEIFFYPDIYGRDTLLAKALFARDPLSQCRYPQ